MKTYAGPGLNVSFNDQLDQGTEHIFNMQSEAIMRNSLIHVNHWRSKTNMFGCFLPNIHSVYECLYCSHLANFLPTSTILCIPLMMETLE